MAKTWGRIWMPSNRLPRGLSSISDLLFGQAVWRSGILLSTNLSGSRHTVLWKKPSPVLQPNVSDKLLLCLASLAYPVRIHRT